MESTTLALEVAQSVVALLALGLANFAIWRADGRHSHGEPPRLPTPSVIVLDVDDPQGVRAVEVTPASDGSHTPVVSRRIHAPFLRRVEPAPEDPPPEICLCGIPGMKCLIHG